MASKGIGISDKELRDIYMSLEKEKLVNIIMDMNKEKALLCKELNKQP